MPKSVLYGILLHNSPKQTLRLLRSIYNSTDQFVLHVDKSATPEYSGLLHEIVAGHPNIRLISNHHCAWGAFSLVAAELDLISTGLEMDPGWTHMILLSGTHLPVWPLETIRRWVIGGLSYVDWYEVPQEETRPDGGWGAALWERYSYYYEEVPGQAMRRGERSPPLGFAYGVGSQWVVLAREHAKYAVRRAPDPIRERLATTLVADSAYFQTVLRNSPYVYRRDGKKRSTAVAFGNNGRPKEFDLDGYLELAQTSQSPFIRKIAEELGDESKVDEAIESVIGPMRPSLVRGRAYQYLARQADAAAGSEADPSSRCTATPDPR